MIGVMPIKKEKMFMENNESPFNQGIADGNNLLKNIDKKTAYEHLNEIVHYLKNDIPYKTDYQLGVKMGSLITFFHTAPKSKSPMDWAKKAINKKVANRQMFKLIGMYSEPFDVVMFTSGHRLFMIDGKHGANTETGNIYYNPVSNKWITIDEAKAIPDISTYEWPSADVLKNIIIYDPLKFNRHTADEFKVSEENGEHVICEYEPEKIIKISADSFKLALTGMTNPDIYISEANKPVYVKEGIKTAIIMPIM